MTGLRRGGTEPAQSGRKGRRFVRTFSRARWDEYRRLLEHALDCGYEVVALEDWVSSDSKQVGRTLVLRHDVDQHPRSVDAMLEIERELGLRSTWYFRWRTADKRTIDAVRAAGGGVGLHYETLTRRLLENRAELSPELVDRCRAELRAEIRMFTRLFGPIRSVCPHGDSRLPGVSNQSLLRGVDTTGWDIAFDGNDAMRRRALAVWLTDRSAADGGWSNGIDPLELISAGESPILCLTHPNNLASGVSLWVDRLAAAVLPAPSPIAGRTLRRTGRDTPLLTAGSSFAPIADDLEREVRRHCADHGIPLESGPGVNTLLTNSHLVEQRADTLIDVLRGHTGLRSIDGLDVLDVGCGFGALAVLFAHRGARVTAIDPNDARMQVGRAVADRHGLPVEFVRGSVEALPVSPRSFDVAVLNNSFCYVVSRARRKLGLDQVQEALRPGGWIVSRNPNRLHPMDQFTGLPGVHLLPPAVLARLLPAARVRRSHVRLLTPAAARREFQRAGYVDVALGWKAGRSLPYFLRRVSRYQHVVARRPQATGTFQRGGS
jgi:SAM-dependent methyltransferase